MDLFDTSEGIVKYDNYRIDLTKPFTEQEDSLLEDLLQIEFPNGWLIDLGWYPEYEPDGAVVLKLIKGNEWNEPVYQYRGISVAELKKSYKTAVGIIQDNTKERHA